MEALQLVPETKLPYIPDLNTEALIQLQITTADTCQQQRFFQDRLSNGTAGPELAIIPAGRFSMGSDQLEFGHRKEEYPQHIVSLARPFAIGRHCITAEQFEVFRAATEWHLRPELIWSKGLAPVINVRLQDARLYLEWLSAETGQRYRLPTEPEWEYAARAGTLTPFSYGQSVSCKEVLFNPAFPYQETLEKKRWYLPRCVPSFKPSEIGLRTPNTWGLYDMHGNVWEFTSTHWTKSHVNAHRDGSPSHHGDPRWYVTKGGSWFDPAVAARSASRKKRYLDEMDTNLGFRVIREL